MNEQEITRRNEAIARFMGAEWRTPLHYPKPCWRFPGEAPPTPHASVCWDYLLYHEDWNWLMPVVEKIETTTSYTRITIWRHTCYVPGYYIAKGQELLIDGATKIEAVWLAVSDFCLHELSIQEQTS